MTTTPPNDPTEPAGDGGAPNPSDVEPVMVTMTFETHQPDQLLALLAKYVVLSRMDPAARNIDLVASATRPGRLTVIEKWESGAAQQAHFDSEVMVEMATACSGLLSAPPDIDLHEPVTMHDLS